MSTELVKATTPLILPKPTNNAAASLTALQNGLTPIDRLMPGLSKDADRQ